ncbi:sugar phosphate isomerase/epimerase family protein [Anaerosporobacter faecicola]|uniref:sugar phosphate isomerase/epimerase family protein n=1 Tax=Anaerosporobacter faecicola TaxID=2718714 RepID=UPI0014389B06|nr:sugar phosphate isomerase/epimerase [Anaerosporobacter faecicola]
MKLSVFYDHIVEACEQRNITEQQAVAFAKEAGIQGFEINLTCLLQRKEEILSLIKDAGMEISCIYEFYDWGNDPSMEKAKEHVRTAQEVGAKKILVVPGLLAEEEAKGIQSASKEYKNQSVAMEQNHAVVQMKENLITLVEYGKEYGITVTLEDFDSILAPFARMNQLLWFMKHVPGLQYTFDMGNFAYSDEDVREAYRILQPYVVHVHCKDRGEDVACNKNNRFNHGLVPCPVGVGYMPIGEMVRTVRSNGYEDYFAIEHFGAEDQIAFLQQSAEFLKAV